MPDELRNCLNVTCCLDDKRFLERFQTGKHPSALNFTTKSSLHL